MNLGTDNIYSWHWIITDRNVKTSDQLHSQEHLISSILPHVPGQLLVTISKKQTAFDSDWYLQRSTTETTMANSDYLQHALIRKLIVRFYLYSNSLKEGRKYAHCETILFHNVHISCLLLDCMLLFTNVHKTSPEIVRRLTAWQNKNITWTVIEANMKTGSEGFWKFGAVR